MSPGSPPTTTSLALVCAPVHKRAFGLAVGIMTGLAVFAVTGFHAALPSDAVGLSPAPLAAYFYGYDVSWRGGVIGLAWGFVTGFVLGWFVAFVRNLLVTAATFVVMTEEEQARTRRFLDHI
jgi:hypothetical protein